MSWLYCCDAWVYILHWIWKVLMTVKSECIYTNILSYCRTGPMRWGGKCRQVLRAKHPKIVYTVQCRHNAVNFLQHIHERHPIARPSGRGMGCFLWVRPLIDILPQFLQWCVQYHVIFRMSQKFFGRRTHKHDLIKNLCIGRFFKHAQRRTQIGHPCTPDWSNGALWCLNWLY